MKAAIVVFLGSALVPNVTAIQVAGTARDAPQQISPPLTNVASDKKFYGPPFPADYHDDVQPRADPDNEFMPAKKRGAIYPPLIHSVDEDHFDRDYVKDENNDGGEWAAQMAYDVARAKVTKAGAMSKTAHERARKEAEDIAAARKRLDEAAAAKKAAEEAEKAARRLLGDYDAHEKELEDLARKSAEEAKKHAADIANKNYSKEEIEKELADSKERLKAAEEAFKKAEDALKECQKTFAVAQAAFKKAQTIHEALLKKRDEIRAKTVDGVDTKDYTDDLKVAEAKKKAAEADEKAAEAKKKAVEAKEDAAEKAYKREARQQEAAEHEAEELEASEQEAKKELDEAKRHLRQLRNPGSPDSADSAGSAGSAGSPGSPGSPGSSESENPAGSSPSKGPAGSSSAPGAKPSRSGAASTLPSAMAFALVVCASSML